MGDQQAGKPEKPGGFGTDSIPWFVANSVFYYRHLKLEYENGAPIFIPFAPAGAMKIKPIWLPNNMENPKIRQKRHVRLQLKKGHAHDPYSERQLLK
jgi:hypothetical protein